MLKFALLATVALSLTDCGPRRQPRLQTTPSPVLVCPSWTDATRGRKAKLADEIEAAPATAVWPDVLVADQGLKDQLKAAGCGPVQ